MRLKDVEMQLRHSGLMLRCAPPSQREVRFAARNSAQHEAASTRQIPNPIAGI
jgi:hypothetical protein